MTYLSCCISKTTIILGIFLQPLFAFSQTVKGLTYPFSIDYLTLQIEGQAVPMAYHYSKPSKPNGKTVLLLHGKNFNLFYWKKVSDSLSHHGYSVIAPDQVGWGKSGFPNIHYSFHRLASNTKKLLDTLGIQKVYLVGHSMGGMLATRFTILYPHVVEKLILENPIGLEDYRTFVPYKTVEEQHQKEKNATYDSYKKYQQTYYPTWRSEYEELVRMQAAALSDPNFEQIAKVNALTTTMIYEQPVNYEFTNIKTPTTFLIGDLDRTIVGKDLLDEKTKSAHGQVPALAKAIATKMSKAQVILFPNVGHIPHIQIFEQYMQHLLQILNK